jgi:hypothetical protein
MNCHGFDELLPEIARDAELDANLRRWALDHAAGCPACAQRLEDERNLTASLRALRESDSAQAPAASCEATLLAAYRMERRSEVHSRRWSFAVAGAMAASVLLLLGAAVSVWRDSIPFLNPAARPVPALAARSGAESTETLFGSALAGEEEVTDFVAFYPGADLGPLDSGALVRVQVPGSALGAFGLPVAEGSEEQWVNADLLVGDDGSPRAIRFVRSER